MPASKIFRGTYSPRIGGRSRIPLARLKADVFMLAPAQISEQLREAGIPRMASLRPRSTRARNALAFLIVRKIIAHLLHAVAYRTIGDDLLTDYEQRIQIGIVVGKIQGARQNHNKNTQQEHKEIGTMAHRADAQNYF